MRFYTDEDVPPQFAALATARGFDVLTARDAGMLGRSDREQLAFAAEQGRCLITNNPKDFPEIVREFEQRGVHHSGVLGCPRQMQPNHVGRAFDELTQLIDLYSGEFPRDSLLYLTW